MAKDFLAVLGAIQNTVSKSRRSMSAAKKAEAMQFYGHVAETMINVIGVLDKDLKANENLAKALTTAGEGFKAMKALGMSSTVLNGIKNRLTALAALQKPVASALASTVNGTI